MIIKTCERCGKEFTPAHGGTQSRARFCSHACANGAYPKPKKDLENNIEQSLISLTMRNHLTADQMRKLKAIEVAIKFLSLKNKKGDKDEWGSGLGK